MKLYLLNGDTVRGCLPMAKCIDVMAETMISIYQGKAKMPPRIIAPLPQGVGYLAAMPGALTAPAISGTKLVTLYPDNPAKQLPAVQGLIVLFDLESGEPIALVDAAAITALRTAAASAAATRVLAREDATVLSLLGYGVQAESHLEAILAVRPIKRVLVWGRSYEKAQAFAKLHQREGLVIEAAETVRSAVEQAQIVCTLTGSAEPILEGAWLQPGTHLNLVGAHSPTTREVDTYTMQRSKIVTEIKAFALKEAGDILIPLQARDLTEKDIDTEIAQVLLKGREGRTSPDDITLYKSLGNAAQDLAAAYAALSLGKQNKQLKSIEF